MESIQREPDKVLEERVYHLDDAPETPEPYYQPTGKELQPRPVGEENGIIVYNYNPTSAVHYGLDDGLRLTPDEPVDAEPSSKSESVFRQLRQLRRRLQRTLLHWDPSEYVDRDYSYEEMNDAREILPYDEANRTIPTADESSPTPDRELPTLHLQAPPRCTRSVEDELTAPSVERVEAPTEAGIEDDLREGASSSPDSDPDGGRELRHTGSTSSSTINNNNNNNNNSDDESDESEGEQSSQPVATTAASATNRAPALCPQFSRSTVGGSKAQPAAHPTPLDPDDLVFESRFESGNLGRAIKITPTYYELYLRPDMYTNRHTQWFYFQVKNTKAKVVYS
uniref:Pepdidase_M14_N domain-containing protein n=1 Tax=Anopheles epiroticus TaxID=199890 RepID=A0A182PFB6_9DIPT